MVRDDPCRLVRQVKEMPSLELVTNDRKTPATSCGR
jgi:hypothetical protein